MPRFPSAEWVDAFCAQLEAEDDAEEVAESLDGVYRLVVEPAGPVDSRHVHEVEIRAAEDGAVRARRLDADGVDPRLTLTANYERWKQLLTGRLDIGMAVMLRRLKISGDMSDLIRDLGSTRPLLNALRAVETEWPER